MLALNFILFASLMSVALAGGGSTSQCQREAGDAVLEVVLVQISLGTPPVLDKTYPDCKITCIKCLILLEIEAELVINQGGCGCANVNALLVNVQLGIGVLCTIWGVNVGPGQGPICTS